ncbi:MAG: 23S rRNA (guanosine(2251)-2'-O)-methyltransferase RlmB, partial [Gammaproteobacteria bacterium]
LEISVSRERKDRRLDKLIDSAVKVGIAVNEIPRASLDKMADDGTHQGVIARSRPRPAANENDLGDILDRLEGPAFLLVLDGVQDPHNLGACLRTADAVGVNAVIVPKDRAVGLTPVVRKTASGAAETVPFIRVNNIARTLRHLKERGIWVVGASGETGSSFLDADLRGPLAIVMGSEGKGLRRLTREHCDLLADLPMQGEVESLNVSVAAGVCLYTALSQRLSASI